MRGGVLGTSCCIHSHALVCTPLSFLLPTSTQLPHTLSLSLSLSLFSISHLQLFNLAHSAECETRRCSMSSDSWRTRHPPCPHALQPTLATFCARRDAMEARLEADFQVLRSCLRFVVSFCAFVVGAEEIPACETNQNQSMSES